MNAEDITRPGANAHGLGPDTAVDSKAAQLAEAAKTPIAGYGKPTEEMVLLVNEFKKLEADIGALWRKVKATGLADGRMLAEGKTSVQTGMMWLNRSIFKSKDVFDEE